MKRTELDVIFTNKVNEYLARGYVFNTNTMSGSQGEIAHVDLRKGDEILRIVMDGKYDWRNLVFSKIAENWYASEEEGAAANELRKNRYSSRHVPAEKELSVTAALIRLLKSRKGFTNATRNNITVRRCAAGYKIIMASRNGSSKQELIRFPNK